MTDEQILADALREGEPITYGSKSLPVLIKRVKDDQVLIAELAEALEGSGSPFGAVKGIRGGT